MGLPKYHEMSEEDFCKAIEEEERLEKEWAEKLVAEQKVYDARWPCHCKDCDGWGEHSWVEHHGPGLNEPMSDYCETCIGQGNCPRCGAHIMEEEEGEPCTECGWTSSSSGRPQF